MELLAYLHLLIRLIFVALIISLSFIDYYTMRLPDKLTIPLMGIGLLNAFLYGRQNGLVSLLTALGAGGVFWLIARFYPQGLGLGDVKFVTGLGAFLGFPFIFLSIFLACLVGSSMGIFLLLLRKIELKQQMPFGPYLSLGSLIVLLWGNKILDFYWSFLVH